MANVKFKGVGLPFGAMLLAEQKFSKSVDLSSPSVFGTRRSAVLKHGKPPQMCGMLQQEFTLTRLKITKFCELQGEVLIITGRQAFSAAKEITVMSCLPGRRKLQLIVRDSRNRRYSFIAPTQEEFRQWLQALTNSAFRTFEDLYEIGDIIGRGCYGKVFEATSRQGGDPVAVKILDKTHTPREDIVFLHREMEIVKKVNHPCVVRTYDIFNTADKLYIVLEKMNGGVISRAIKLQGNGCSEMLAKHIMRQVIKGVKYIHSMGIVHRDIKPENILCVDDSWPPSVKLTDFGLSSQTHDKDGGSKISSAVGTVSYVAPEIATKKSYDSKVDLWSCGICLYKLVCDNFPFDSISAVENAKLAKTVGVQFAEEEWKDFSDDGKSFAKFLLQPEPHLRPTAAQALCHPWMSELSDRTSWHKSR
mmetsp:Transcript_3456/g.10471  ORF Transcript_3456/g.10471 Transcript_3456/m.10471 type:complete len:419 (+) Transcript_3456:290-1546(+)